MPEEKPLALHWNQPALDAFRCTKTSPPLAARALAMVRTAMYDAWSVYQNCPISATTDQYIKIFDQKNCTKEHIRKAFSYAAYRVLTDLFWQALPWNLSIIKLPWMKEILRVEWGYAKSKT